MENFKFRSRKQFEKAPSHRGAPHFIRISSWIGQWKLVVKRIWSFKTMIMKDGQRLSLHIYRCVMERECQLSNARDEAVPKHTVLLISSTLFQNWLVENWCTSVQLFPNTGVEEGSERCTELKHNSREHWSSGSHEKDVKCTFWLRFQL